MVKLHVKRGDETQFLFETTVQVQVSDLVVQLVRLYNGRLKVERLCQGKAWRSLEGELSSTHPSITFHRLYTEMELLAEHGILLPHDMQGLTEEQVVELKLQDECADVCTPSGGYVDAPDPMGRRNGRGDSLLPHHY